MSGPHDNERCPSCGRTEGHGSDCGWVGNPNRRKTIEEEKEENDKAILRGFIAEFERRGAELKRMREERDHYGEKYHGLVRELKELGKPADYKKGEADCG